MGTRYFTVASSRDNEHTIERYLYSHSRIAERLLGRGVQGWLIETTSADAVFHAQYQADRFASGLIGVSPVTPDKASAIRDFERKFG